MFGIFYFSGNIKAANFIDGYLWGNDSGRYTEGAEKILNFEIPTGKTLSYLGYVLFIAFFENFDLDLSYVAISQIFLTIISSLCIYRITKKFSSHVGGVLSISLYLFYLPLQIRNFYILTETIFICSIIFLIYFVVFYKKKFLPLIIFFIIFIITIRPHGILIIPSFFLSILIWSYYNDYKKLFYIIIINFVILSYPTLLLLNLYLENENIIAKIYSKGIIYGYENENNYINFKDPLNINSDLFSLIIYLGDNFNAFITSFLKKLWFFLLRVRPFYSDVHSIYLIVINFIYLPLAMFGMFKVNLKKELGTILMFLLILVFSMSVGFTFADWSGRFSLYILPIFFIFAGIGFSSIFKTYFNK